MTKIYYVKLKGKYYRNKYGKGKLFRKYYQNNYWDKIGCHIPIVCQGNQTSEHVELKYKGIKV